MISESALKIVYGVYVCLYCKSKSIKCVCECMRVSGRRREIPTVKSHFCLYKSVFTWLACQSPTSTSLSDPKQPLWPAPPS